MKKVVNKKISELENTSYVGAVGTMTYPESDERAILVLKAVLQESDDMLHEEYLSLVKELQTLKNTNPRARKVCSRILWIGDYFAQDI
jgi:hypothetical protein